MKKKTEQEPVQVEKTSPEYSVSEFCMGARQIFGVGPDIVRAALLEKGVTTCSKAEAEKIVKAFKEKEVK